MKKVLIVAYYWPPAGGSGVQRWLYFAKYLRDFGIEPIIYTPENPAYPVIDDSLKKEIPENLSVIKRPIIEPSQLTGLFFKKQTKNLSSGLIEAPKNQSWLQKRMLFIRGNYFIPDARVLWVKPSVKFLKQYLLEEKIDTIITTGTPHSMHLIGLKLKKQLDINWIADFRDPWTEIVYHDKLQLTQKSADKHKEMELEVLQTADTCITTSFKTKDDFKKLTKRPIEVITNGYEKQQDMAATLDQEFTFSHIGLLTPGRNPENLWQVFSELIDEDETFKTKFKLRLIGTVGQEILDSIAHYNLTPYLELTGYVSHEEALKYQTQSQVLLLLETNDKIKECIIPGKVFEYLNSKRPLIAIGPPNWDLKNILAATKGGNCFTYVDKEALKTQVKQYFNAYLDGNLKSDAQNLEQYHRRNLTERLAEIIKG